MTHAGYKQFCPLAMASEVLCTRWTPILIREFIAGSTRFGDLRRGVPKMSPSLLSKRLKEVEGAGVVERKRLPSERGVYEYHLTGAGRDRGAVIAKLGEWEQQWCRPAARLDHLD